MKRRDMTAGCLMKQGALLLLAIVQVHAQLPVVPEDV